MAGGQGKTRSGRTIKMSEKMEDYMKKLQEGNTARYRKELLDKAVQAETLLTQDEVQVQDVQEKYEGLVAEHTKLVELEEAEKNELNQEEAEIYVEYYEEENATILNSTQAIKSFLAQNDVEPGDSVSQTGSKATDASHASRHSHIEAIIAEKTRQAVLEMEMQRIQQQADIDKEKQQLAELRKKLEQKEKLMELERELALSKAKVDIISQAGSTCGSRTSKCSRASKRVKPMDDAHDTAKKRFEPPDVKTSSPAPGYVPPKFDYTQRSKRLHESTPDNDLSGNDNIENVFSKLASAIDRNSRQTVLIEPQVFDGDVLSYELWKRSFEELVERDVKLERRFIYLLKYTSGQARECIDNLTHLENVEAFKEGMKMLDERYGDKFLTYEAIRGKLDSWPYIKDGEGVELRRFADFLNTCLAVMKQNPSLKILDSMPENHKLLRKLPRRMVDRWSSKVDEWQYGDKSDRDAREYPPFQVFVEFVRRQARIELGPVKRMLARNATDRNKPVRVHLTEVEEGEEVTCFATATETSKRECLYCKAEHELKSCTKFANIPTKERLQFSYDKRLCRGCLETGHFAWACKNLHRCDQCQGRHHSLFHDDNFRARRGAGVSDRTRDESQAKDKKTVLSTRVVDDNITAHIVLVELRNKLSTGSGTKVYVVIDNQSNACFIAPEVARMVSARGEETNVELHTMAGVEDVTMTKVENLSVRNPHDNICIDLPPTYIKSGMETGHEQIPTPEQVGCWKHLQRIHQHIHPVDKSIPIGLLIGRNCFRGTKLTDFIPSKETEPYAVCTELGWGIVGKLDADNTKEKSTVWVHTITTVEQSPAKFFESYNADFQDQHAEGKLSQDDLRFMKCLEDGLIIEEDGRLMFPLPMKKDVIAPDNTGQALGALRSLKKKFLRDEAYKEKFISKMDELFAKGYAEPAPKEVKPGRAWRLTFHGVFHPKKVDELRVVFNGAREYLGFVLNEALLQGPDQINNLIGVFCRFRKEVITLTCDIEAMFYQVHVIPDDRDFLRFFWWPEGNLDAEPEEYRMLVHIFGATSSPGVANHALLKIAEMYEEKYGEEAARFIREGFYVDDGVTCTGDDDKAVALMKSSRGMLGEGRMNLTKFSSNSKKVVEQIPESIRAKNLKEWDMVKDLLPQGYTLGIFLCQEEDCIRYQVQLKATPRTRRGILSTTSQVYDPMGLVSPFLLEGRRILQQLCKGKIGWDEVIPDEALVEWDEWLAQIKSLEDIKFPRCYSSRGVEASVSRELHHFADASLKGYGQCSYLRLQYEQGEVETALVMAKAKVLPKQTVTVPRLELAAAVLAVRTARFLEKQMKIDKIVHHYWSDSRVVLGYINNDSKRFHVYVANRVANIREFTQPEQWHHVDTEQNPADIASRGATVQELMSSELWKRGPGFLREQKTDWQVGQGIEQEEDPEVRKIIAYKTEIAKPSVNWEQKFESFSTWKSLTRGMAKVMQLTDVRKDKTDAHAVTLEERKEAEMFVIKVTQQLHFNEEINALKRMKKTGTEEMASILVNGRLRKLDAFIDENDVLRVGGRFKHGPWSYGLKHPIILPNESQVSYLLMKYLHAQVAHSGREATMSAIRASGYWILALRRKLDSIIWRCTICRRFRGKACSQKMGEMPEERQEEVPAFTHVGVDFFGPYAVKQNRASVKRWVVIYTCLVTRAQHLDKAYGMSAEQFINSYRRFLARRGAVKTLRCDRGTNFLGAKDEIERCLDDVFDDTTKQYLIDANCEFVQMKMNPPSASHMGGVWERPIGTGKRIINILLHEHAHMLDDDLLDTVLAEAEAIMNGMPLTCVDTSGADSMKPLTPAMLLTMKPSVAPPPLHRFNHPDVYSRKRWKRAQHVVDEFWKRWRHELTPRWQERKKWARTERNLQVGDVILLMDEDTPRMCWPMGIVEETFPGKDNLVRSVKIRTQKTTYTRPVHKLLLLLEGSNPVMGAD